jgi:hypothetical protein
MCVQIMHLCNIAVYKQQMAAAALMQQEAVAATALQSLAASGNKKHEK